MVEQRAEGRIVSPYFAVECSTAGLTTGGKKLCAVDWDRVVCSLQGTSRTSMLTAICLDVLNRFTDAKSCPQTIHVMKYIFPRQFGLQNVFTPTSRNGTADQFNIHASREKEIAEAGKRKKPQHIHYMDDLVDGSQKIPKRLRGHVVGLVRALRVRHARCSYSELLKYYCPPDVSPFRDRAPFLC